ncbi:SDR family oxidoreductase [Candidatus Thorarchaeota archaeon]|nr:MAG: SDR family oxidoreductase [Candidatus Thorarchaeota archaeon]
MDLELKDKFFLVTAASRGLGFGVAKALVEEGAKVTICGRTKEDLEAAQNSLGERARYVIADVSKEADIKKLIDDVENVYGRLDGLYVNAGGPPPGTFNKTSDEEWRSSIDLNLMSAVWLTREAQPLLKKSEHSSILYSTSISVKQPLDNLLLSNSIRAAVIGMMRTISTEFGLIGIRVNAICPGYIYTERVEQLIQDTDDKTAAKQEIIERIPIGRMGTPDEFGRICTFLLSPIAGYIHGALLLVDGGMYQGMM